MAFYKITFKTHYGREQTQTISADSAETAQQKAPTGVQVISVVETSDPSKFRSDLFRKEFRENVKHLDEDSIADYHEKVESGEITLDPPVPPQKQTDDTAEVYLEGRANVGELLKYQGKWYVSQDSYEVFGEEDESYGWETRARLATDAEIVAGSTTPSTRPKSRQSERARFLADHGVPEGADPKHYLTDKNLRRLAEMDD